MKEEKEEIYFEVTEEMEEERIDKLLPGIIDSLSRSYIQQLIKEGRLWVNQKPVKANYRVKAGEKIRLELPPAIEPDIQPENIPLEILYEDEDV